MSDMNEKMMAKMASKLARMALISHCMSTAKLLTEDKVETDQEVVNDLASSLFGACGLLASSKHPGIIPTGEEVLETLKKAVIDMLSRLQEAQERAMAECMAEEQKDTLDKCKVAEPEPDTSAPAQEEDVPVPEFKGMTDAEIARSMGIVLGE